jgi:hypothetical protein
MSTATYIPATTYIDSTMKESDDIFTTRIYEGEEIICISETSSCSFEAPACGTGIHTYFARTHSLKYSLESEDSNSVTWEAPDCTQATQEKITFAR